MKARQLRRLAAPFVAAAPAGARIRTSVHTTASEHEVLATVGAHLGRLANRDLAERCALGVGAKHKGRAERKRALTAQCSSRWAGSITRHTDDMWERQLHNYRDELIDKQAAAAAIEKRLAEPVGESGGYATKQERFAKQQRLQVLRRRVDWLTERVESGRVSVVRGNRRLLHLRNNLEAADLNEQQWRTRWDAARWFITADGDSSYEWGNGLISVNTDTGVVSVTLPAPLRHLANAPRGRFVLQRPVMFNHRCAEWAAQATVGAVAYELRFDVDRERWYLDAFWQPVPVEMPSLHQLRRRRTLAVDLNANHMAAWVISPDGNPVGDPITITYDPTGSAGRNCASLRHAITQLLHTAQTFNCASVSIENLNFCDARSTGRERMGRGLRGRRFRRTVASMPTAQFRARLVAMAYNAGIAVIAVDPAYTTRWGREHWLAPLNQSRRTPCSGHQAAAVVIGRRALGLPAKRRSSARDGTTGTRQRTGLPHCGSGRSRTSKLNRQAPSVTPRKHRNPSSAPTPTRGVRPAPLCGVAETRTRQPDRYRSQGTYNRSGRPSSGQPPAANHTSGYEPSESPYCSTLRY